MQWNKCEQSGSFQMLSWLPDDKGFPGAVVCLGCQFGIMVRKGSTHEAISQSGHKGVMGVVRTHYVSKDMREARYRIPRKVKLEAERN